MSRQRRFQNLITLSVKKGSGEEQVLNLYYPTYELATCMAIFLKRCLMIKDFDVDLKYSTPSGFVSMYKGGPSKIRMTEGKFKALKEIRDTEASARLKLRIFRDASYGGDMILMFYFYGKTDLNMAHALLKLGLSDLWTTCECETRDTSKEGVWFECNEQGFCDGELATLVNRLDPVSKIRAIEFVTQLLGDE